MKILRILLRETTGFVLRFSGIAWAVRSVFSRHKVTILVYHRPAPQSFKAHIEYLKKRYRLIPLDVLLDAIENGDTSDVPPKALVVTIDDGHKSNYKLLPIIKEFGVRPTFYVCSHIVGTNRHFWWLEAPNGSARKIKKLPVDNALEKLRKEAGYDTKKEYRRRQALSESEINEMEPYADFGTHSKYHTILPSSDDRECMDEIRDSKARLETLLGKPVMNFAYPNGDLSEREIEYLRASGYRSARTLDVGWNTVDSDPFRLKAIAVDDNASINVLCGQLSGVFAYFKYLCHGSFNGKRPPLL